MAAWTEERRKAQAEKMRKLQEERREARRRQGVQEVETPPEETPDPNPPERWSATPEQWSAWTEQFREEHAGLIRAFSDQAEETYLRGHPTREWRWTDREFRLLVARLNLEVEHFVSGLISQRKIAVGPHRELVRHLQGEARRLVEIFLKRETE